MPLYVRNDDVPALAVSLHDRLAPARALVDAIGPGDPDFDIKAYTDAL